MEKPTKLNQKEIDALFERLKNQSATDNDFNVIHELFQFNAWLQDSLAHAKLSIKALRKLFGFKKELTLSSNEKPKNIKPVEADDCAEKDNVEKTIKTEKAAPSKKANWKQGVNHGRLGAAAYTGCAVEAVPFTDEKLKQGYCPDCAACDTLARVYPKKPSSIVLLQGSPLVTGTRYDLEKARCQLCQQYFTAPLPTHLSGDKYDVTCSSVIAINHYFSGMPFSRLETLQSAQGIPLPDATQYELVKKCYYNACVPVLDVLAEYAANGNGLYADDTSMKLMAQITENKNKASGKNKRAIHGTVLLSEYQGHAIYLYQTDTKVAGAAMSQLFKKRHNDEPFFTMTDASHHNTPTLSPELQAKWIMCYCLVHGRRQFYKLINSNGLMDDEVKTVLDIISGVYDNERACKAQKLSAEKRLAYHQKHSSPLMQSMKVWLNNLLLFSESEPNSPLGKAVAYMLRHFTRMTQFLIVPGVPLDNNICEQAIRVLICYRKNSLFYRSYEGAKVGDGMMSLLQTAAKAGANIFDYLNALQRYQVQVNRSPADWLPWNYQTTLAEQERLAA